MTPPPIDARPPETAALSFSLRDFDARSVVIAVLAAGALLRFLLAESTGLGVDESYAVAVARQFSLSYFDHPPLHFWLAGAMAKLAHSESGEVVRLPFVLCFAATTWLMYRIGTRFFGEKAGALAALLLNISAVFSVTTGGWVLPDGPLMLFMLASVAVIADILFDGASEFAPRQVAAGPGPAQMVRGSDTLKWVVAGMFAGLAMLSKYHGAFVLAGTFLFLLSSAPHRKWLARPGPYLGALVAFALFTPVLAWNREHGWVSFAFQGGRTAGGGGVYVGAMLANIAGQAGYVLPWIWVPLVVVLWGALRTGPRDAARWFFVCLGIGPIAAFTLIALRGGGGLPHWEAPGYLMLFPMLGSAAANRLERGDALVRRWLRWSAWTFVVLVAILATQTANGWMQRLAPSLFAKGDPTTDMISWRELRPTLDARGMLSHGEFLAAPSWIQAGEAALGTGPDVPVLCLCADPHHFYYMNDDRAFLGRDAVFVKKLKPDDDVVAAFAPYFESFEMADTLVIHRAGAEAMRVGIYRARGFRKLFPTMQPR
ncbi:MAG TPA: glycosyltransferase family 39 protein [Gemmatimonadaceae bacterium]